MNDKELLFISLGIITSITITYIRFKIIKQIKRERSWSEYE
jgi:hypothetical protein